MKSPQPSNNPTAVIAWSPLRRAVFRSIWIASVTANIGLWMHSVGAAWRRPGAQPRYEPA